MTQVELLKKCLLLLVSKGACPETKPTKWVEVLWYMHNKGWLFAHTNNDEVDVVVGAYRIKEFDEKQVDTLPINEEGEILFVPFLASKSDDVFMVRKMLNAYMEEYPIKEIIFYERNDDKNLKRFKRIGGLNVETESPRLTSSTNISS